MSQFSKPTKFLRVCFVHDWLVTMRGGEKVLEALVELFPNAPIYTLFMKRDSLSNVLKKRTIYTSFLQVIPGVAQIYRCLLPIFPLAVRSLRTKNYDLVISSSHCVAKAVKVRKDAFHICYCHTPMRYLWGFSEEYFGKFPLFLRKIIEFYFNFLKKWDIQTSRRVNLFIANSQNTAKKIQKLYGKVAKVIYPPVDIPPDQIEQKSHNGEYYLIVGALVPYKKLGLAIEAFNRLNRPLKIVGDGPIRKKLERLVRSKKIQFERWVDNDKLWTLYLNAKALIFPGEEDFGIVPVEAQMLGKPVIAFGKGGVRETVVAYNHEHAGSSESESTGIFFYEANPNSLIECVLKSEALKFNAEFIKSHARRFTRDRFQQEIKKCLDGLAYEETFH